VVWLPPHRPFPVHPPTLIVRLGGTTSPTSLFSALPPSIHLKNVNSFLNKKSTVSNSPVKTGIKFYKKYSLKDAV
jgi:hypothetical protein